MIESENILFYAYLVVNRELWNLIKVCKAGKVSEIREFQQLDRFGSIMPVILEVSSEDRLFSTLNI